MGRRHDARPVTASLPAILGAARHESVHERIKQGTSADDAEASVPAVETPARRMEAVCGRHGVVLEFDWTGPDGPPPAQCPTVDQVATMRAWALRKCGADHVPAGTARALDLSLNPWRQRVDTAGMEHQPREHPVRCCCCLRSTWAWSALCAACERVAARR